MTPFTHFTSVCWGILLAYWFASSLKVKRTVYRQNAFVRFLTGLSMWFAYYLVYSRRDIFGFLDIDALPHTALFGLLGDVLCASGVAFAIWARYVLGTNWSATPTLKENHELIRSGPYRIVRHPIYTGFLLGLLGAAVTVGLLRAFVGLIVLFVSFWLKLGAEEKIMTSEFPDAYAAYRREVKAVIPFVL